MELLEVFWMDFGNKLPCKYISYSFEWADDSLEVKVVGQLKARMGLDSPQSHRLKWISGLDFAKFKQSHAIRAYRHDAVDWL